MIIIDDIDYSGIILYTLLQRISIYKFMSEIYLLIDGIIYCQRTLQIHQGAKYLTHIEIRISSCKSFFECLLAIKVDIKMNLNI